MLCCGVLALVRSEVGGGSELVGGDGGWRGRHRPTRKQEKAELERVGTVGRRKWGGGRSGELERQFSTSMRGYVRMDSGWDGRGWAWMGGCGQSRRIRDRHGT